MRRWLIVASIGIAFASAVHGQALYQTRFDNAGGWTFDPPGELNSVWSVDALPAYTTAGPFHSAPSSLNYNNDVDYDGGGYSYANGSNATSPAIDLSAATGTPTLFFWCNNRLAEQLCDNHESITVRVMQGTTLKLVRCLTCGSCYQNMGQISPCDYSNWHEHAIALDPSWGVVNIVFRFRGDAIANQTEGYFVDDLSVIDVQPTTSYCTAKLNTQGCAATMASAGVPDLSSSAPFAINASQVLNQKNGLLFYGLNGRVSAPFLGGFLCVKPPTHRTAVQNSGGNPPPDDCSGALSFDFNAWARSGIDPALVAGVHVDAQYWYRDPADPHRTGLSDALEFSLLP